jgi:TM2 domain-containing membrane protein YozV
MAKTVTDTNAEDKPIVEIDLKDPRLAAFLAWLVPGLGHIYQGRTGKGVLFFVCIIGTFFYGWYVGGERVVYASTANVFSMQFLQDRWQYVCQVGAGLPALPALVERQRMREGKAPLFGELMRPPNPAQCTSTDQTDPNHVVQHPDELAKWNYDLGDFFEIGTVFTVIAGLLNILAIYDAYGGPLIIIPDDKKKQLATAQ